MYAFSRKVVIIKFEKLLIIGQAGLGLLKY